MKFSIKNIQNYAIGLYMLSIIIFIVVPLPSVVLDVGVAFNMALAMIILFNALFSTEVLNMSSFTTHPHER